MDGELRRARDAFRTGAYAEAIPLLAFALQRDPSDVDAHLLLARCFLMNGQASTAWQILKTLIQHPEVRLNVPLPQAEADALGVETLERWARDVEKAGFPGGEIDAFERAAKVYETLPGSAGRRMRLLADGLRRKRPGAGR